MGLLFFALARDRRRVVAKNLELCFPKLLPRERARLRLKHFMSLGRAIADCSIVWWSKASSIKKLAKIEGKEILDKALVSPLCPFVALKIRLFEGLVSFIEMATVLSKLLALYPIVNTEIAKRHHVCDTGIVIPRSTATTSIVVEKVVRQGDSDVIELTEMAKGRLKRAMSRLELAHQHEGFV